MEVYIKDMEMPKNCTECKIKGEGSDSLYTWSCPFTGFEYTRYDCLNDRLDDCPLIEVNAPHGDLIDGDLLKRRAQKVATEAWKMKLTAKIETTLNQFIDWINDAPIIIKGSSDVK